MSWRRNLRKQHPRCLSCASSSLRRHQLSLPRCHGETDRLRTRFNEATVHRPTASGLSGRRSPIRRPLCASRPEVDLAIGAIIDGDTLAITMLDWLGRSTQNILAFADELRVRLAVLRVLNLGGDGVDTETPIGSLPFRIMEVLPKWNTRSNANASPIPSMSADTQASAIVPVVAVGVASRCSTSAITSSTEA